MLDTSYFKVKGSDPLIGFEQPAHGDSVGWNRYLTLLGERAYLIGGACDTCAFLFERMGGANRNVSPEKASDALRRGLEKIEDTLAGAIGNDRLHPMAPYPAHAQKAQARSTRSQP